MNAVRYQTVTVKSNPESSIKMEIAQAAEYRGNII